MPITEQEALAWTGPTAADSLVPLPTERLTAATMRLILDFSTEVIHCFIAGGASPPLFALAARVDGSRDLMNCCRRVLERDNSKRRTCDEAPSPDYVAGTRSTQDSFLRTFGHQHEIGNLGGYPFIKLMFHPQLSADMHAYISEAVRIMMSYVTSRRSFITLLYAGSRDWQTCSAWTRGKVLLVARSYREAVERGKEQHAHHKANELLVSMGLEPNHSLAHLPSLSARQARRSGISERELRARWG